MQNFDEPVNDTDKYKTFDNVEINPEKQKLADDCFKYNNDIEVLYMTTDLQIFPLRNSAVSHAAANLTDKVIIEFWRYGEPEPVKKWGWDGISEQISRFGHGW